LNVAPLSLVRDLPLDNSLLERANYVDAGMVTDVVVVDGYDSYIPVFEHPNYPANISRVIQNIEQTHQVFLDVLKLQDPTGLIEEIDAKADKIQAIVVDLYKNMCQDFSCMRDLATYHARQDRKTMWKLKK